jgi:hypothetical protein
MEETMDGHWCPNHTERRGDYFVPPLGHVCRTCYLDFQADLLEARREGRPHPAQAIHQEIDRGYVLIGHLIVALSAVLVTSCLWWLAC